MMELVQGRAPGVGRRSDGKGGAEAPRSGGKHTREICSNQYAIKTIAIISFGGCLISAAGVGDHWRGLKRTVCVASGNLLPTGPQQGVKG